MDFAGVASRVVDNLHYCNEEVDINASADQLRELALSKRHSIIQEIAIHPNVPDDLLLSFLKNPSIPIIIRKMITITSNMEKEAYQIMANDCSPYMRMRAARSRKCQVDVMFNLAYDDDMMVRVTLAENTSITKELMYILMKDNEYMVPEALVMNPNVPQSILQELACHEDILVRYRVCSNRGITIETLKVLENSDDKIVSRQALDKLAQRVS